MISKATKGEVGYLQKDGADEKTAILPWTCSISSGPGRGQTWVDLDGIEWEHGGEIHLNTPLFMACHSVHAQLYTGSLFLAHPATPSWLYLHNSRKAKNNDGLLGGLVLPLRLFDTLVISSFQSLFQPWISLNLGICPQTLSLVAKVYASDFTPASLELEERNHFFWGAHPNAVFGTRQHFDSQQAYFWNEGRNIRVKNCYRGDWHWGHWKYLLIWGVHFCDEHILRMYATHQCFKRHRRQLVWFISALPILQSPWQEDGKLETSLSHMASSKSAWPL